MTNRKHNVDRGVSVPEDMKPELGAELQDIAGLMARHGLTAQDLKDILVRLTEAPAASEATAAPPASPLALLAASVAVAEAADVLTHHYARQANEAGFSWQAIAEAAGYKSAQAAHWRWSKNAKDTSGFGLPANGGQAPTTHGSNRAAHRSISPQAEGWMTATQLGRSLGMDPRTVRAKADRGELDVLSRAKGVDGRNRDLYRPRQD